MLKLAGNTGMMLLGMSFFCLPRVAGRSGILADGYNEPGRNQEAGRDIAETEREDWGVEFVQDGNRKFLVLPYGNQQR